MRPASDVGGTWYWNRYPGARCDIESVHYSYSFSEELQQDWEWSERFAGQPEILRYLNHVADRFDLRKDIVFDTRVNSMVWDDDASLWRVGTELGDTVTARYVISGAGNLSVPKMPEFDGVESFRGQVYLTGNWLDENVDFTGQRVAIIGTGSSGIQAISEIAKTAGHLTVFQRTPNYATPIVNGPADPDVVSAVKANYAQVRDASRNHFLGVPYTQVQPSALAVSAEERRRTFDERWNAGGFQLFIDSYQDILFDKKANDTIAEYIRERIHEPGERPGRRRPARAQGLSLRHQAPAAGDQLLRGVQPGQRDAGRHQDRPDRVDHRDRGPYREHRVRVRHHRARHRLRRHDRSADEAGHRRARRAEAVRQVGARSAHLSGPHGERIPEPVPDHRAAEPVGAVQHAAGHRRPRRFRRRSDHLHARPRTRRDRGDARVRGQMGGRCPRDLVPDAAAGHRLLVHGRQHPRQAAHLHVVSRRRAGLPGHVRRRGGQRVRGVHARPRRASPSSDPRHHFFEEKPNASRPTRPGTARRPGRAGDRNRSSSSASRRPVRSSRRSPACSARPRPWPG